MVILVKTDDLFCLSFLEGSGGSRECGDASYTFLFRYLVFIILKNDNNQKKLHKDQNAKKTENMNWIKEVTNKQILVNYEL